MVMRLEPKSHQYQYTADRLLVPRTAYCTGTGTTAQLARNIQHPPHPHTVPYCNEIRKDHEDEEGRHIIFLC
jgi:hypothetical protein